MTEHSGQERADRPTRRVPSPEGDWLQVAFSPELPEIRSGPGQVVDHCLFQASNGRWQLWTQIRSTAIGRLFYRWEGSDVFETPDWTPRGICWRAERGCGESWGTEDDERIHAPYVRHDSGQFVMYYGGGPSRGGGSQICAAVSRDGVDFQRVTDNRGQSQIFSGPGVARDPMVIKTDHGYVMYYAANEGERGIIAARTSDRAYGAPWSGCRIASENGVCGNRRWTQQCPFVVLLDGYYYLFKMGPSGEFKTAVYRSEDPMFFGAGDERLVTVVEASAAEIVREGGQFYISSLIPGYEGVRIRRLNWVRSD